jgi:hypothetical protein
VRFCSKRTQRSEDAYTRSSTIPLTCEEACCSSNVTCRHRQDNGVLRLSGKTASAHSS